MRTRCTGCGAASPAVPEGRARVRRDGSPSGLPHPERVGVSRDHAHDLAILFDEADDLTDGAPTRIFVLVLTTPAGSEPYLQFIASLMGTLSDQGRARVLAAQTPDELVAALTTGA